MKFISIVYFSFKLAFLASLGITAQASSADWQWESDFRKVVTSADYAINGKKIGSYGVSDYRAAIFSVGNLISKGWSSQNFDAERYNSVLQEVWNNPDKIRIFNDDLVKLAALSWRLNLKSRCYDSGVDVEKARTYFTKMLHSGENILINRAILGLGLIGGKSDVDLLIKLLIENQDSFKGNSALNSLLLVEDVYARESMRSKLDELTNRKLKSKALRELSYNIVGTERCTNN
ncbi:hypothetical protein [Pseudoalteromonas luteoviolacea]|uniref:Uncharacterized protein n=1 Tax=Pseudoalteromonas luteoviolacea S4060-1 TaxID=1365257 RepID=A0A167P0F0_9GAMM|nr:hypothetical protein [Pseudoalteromonas luteoviolacea]KZN69232.1 hypothetical protein N478_11405 [Pseudoalteromonas luteoviolacea S4060-1]